MHSQELPSLEGFSEKFCRAVRDSGVESAFLGKWGLSGLEDLSRILQGNIQGGYDSYRHSILGVPAAGSVLSIGPGLGLCEFLLAEVYDRVLVAEPDSENCRLISEIARSYRTARGTGGDRILRVMNAGLSVTNEAIRYWRDRRRALQSRNCAGSILNFDLQSASELAETFSETVRRVFLHKVLSTLSISTNFGDALRAIEPLVGEGGAITWSEPQYIFREELGVEGLPELAELAAASLLQAPWRCSAEEYEITVHTDYRRYREQWVLLRVRRVGNGGS